MKGNLTKMESGCQQGELSPTTSIVDPTRRDVPCKSVLSYHPNRRKKGFFFCRATSPASDKLSQPANEKSLYSELPVYFKDFSFIRALPNYPLSSLEEGSSPLFSRLAYGFALACLS